MWIATSACVIMHNKYIMDNLDFPFPITLALFHMAFSATVAHAAVGLGLVEKPGMPWETYWRAVLPIGVLYSLILSLSNTTYMYLSVSFIQMLKALSPATIYGIGCMFGTERWSWRLAMNLAAIILGVIISAYGATLPLVDWCVSRLPPSCGGMAPCVSPSYHPHLHPRPGISAVAPKQPQSLGSAHTCRGGAVCGGGGAGAAGNHRP